MNDFLDKLEAVVRKTANTVSTEVNVAAQEQKIKEAYQALGKLYYQAVREGKEPTGPDFADQCRKVDAHRKRIQEIKDSRTVCPEEDFVTVE